MPLVEFNRNGRADKGRLNIFGGRLRLGFHRATGLLDECKTATDRSDCFFGGAQGRLGRLNLEYP
jgi:hypothetical protein